MPAPENERPDAGLSVEDMARQLLEIDSPARLSEFTDAANLVNWVRANIRRMQDTGYGEPPPAVAFSADLEVDDFWRGAASRE